jgi:hypothetical protein
MSNNPTSADMSFQRMLDLMKSVIPELCRFVKGMKQDSNAVPTTTLGIVELQMLAGHLKQNGFAPEGEQLEIDAKELIRAICILNLANEVKGRANEADILGAWGVPIQGGVEATRAMGVLLAQSMFCNLDDVLRALGHAHLGPNLKDERASAATNNGHPPLKLKDDRSRTVAGFTVADVCEMTGAGNDTITRFAKKADVQRPSRGQRDFRFALDATRRILELMATEAGTEQIRGRSRDSLAKLRSAPAGNPQEIRK